MNRILWIASLALLAACQSQNAEKEQVNNAFDLLGVWENQLDFRGADTSVDMIRSLMAIQDSTNSYMEFKEGQLGEARLFEGSANAQKTPFSWEQIGDTIRTKIMDRSFDYLILNHDTLEVISLLKDPFGVRGRLVREEPTE